MEKSHCIGLHELHLEARKKTTLIIRYCSSCQHSGILSILQGGAACPGESTEVGQATNQRSETMKSFRRYHHFLVVDSLSNWKIGAPKGTRRRCMNLQDRLNSCEAWRLPPLRVAACHCEVKLQPSRPQIRLTFRDLSSTCWPQLEPSIFMQL